MRVALYARVSTPKSDKKVTNDGDRERQDPETQLIKLRAFAQARGYEIASEYVDRLSGKDANRPALEAMMKAAFRHEFDAILIVRLDRTMRSIANFVVLNDELNAAKVGLVCTDQLIVPRRYPGEVEDDLSATYVLFVQTSPSSMYLRVQDNSAWHAIAPPTCESMSENTIPDTSRSLCAT